MHEAVELFLHSDSFIFAKPANRFCAANHFQEFLSLMYLRISKNAEPQLSASSSRTRVFLFLSREFRAVAGCSPSLVVEARVININFQTVPIIAEKENNKTGLTV